MNPPQQQFHPPHDDDGGAEEVREGETHHKAQVSNTYDKRCGPNNRILLLPFPLPESFDN